jgi:hypothetical protein
MTKCCTRIPGARLRSLQPALLDLVWVTAARPRNTGSRKTSWPEDTSVNQAIHEVQSAPKHVAGCWKLAVQSACLKRVFGAGVRKAAQSNRCSRHVGKFAVGVIREVEQHVPSRAVRAVHWRPTSVSPKDHKCNGTSPYILVCTKQAQPGFH